jgi:glutathione S-transferase
MKLYYSPGACSLAPHIILRETSSTFDLERVDLGAHKTARGGDYYDVNPKGSVPVLEIDGDARLSECPVICQFIADMAKRFDLMPAAGTRERYRVMEWQNYVTSELHKSFTPLFNPAVDAAGKALFRKILRDKYEWVNASVAGRLYVTGDTFTVADAYLFTVTSWAAHVDLDLSRLASLQQFMRRVLARDTVRDAFKAEGLPWSAT